jgi:hypothetical protein
MNSPNNGRIAILFCGQIRTGVKCYPSIAKFLDFWAEMGDIFIHTWDVDTIPPQGLLKRDPNLVNEKFPVPQSTFDKIKELYNPVEMVVDKLEDFYKKPYNNVPWLYSFIQVNEMRKRREQEQYNGIPYMRVIKMRFDMLFDSNHSIEDELKYMDQKEYLATCDIWNVWPQKVEDIKWIASPRLMDIMQAWAEERLATSNITERHVLDWQEHCKLFLDDRGEYSKPWMINRLYHYRDLHEQLDIDINDGPAIAELNRLRGL